MKLSNKQQDEQTNVLLKLFSAAVEAAQPMHNIERFLPDKPAGRTVVIGAGKASAAMAVAVEAHWQGELSGLVVVPHGHCPMPSQIEICHANHPVPDEGSERAAKNMLSLVSDLTEDDLVLCLISGGGSSLLSLPGEGITLSDKQAINSALLKSGAAIDEMNCVRKHLSAIKGGRLAAAAYPAKLVTLAISDVPGDDLSIIASGPTVADNTTSDEALAIIERYDIALNENVLALLNSDAANTPSSDDKHLSNIESHLVCKPQQSLEAAATLAEEYGFNTIILGDAIEGEAKEVGKVMAGIAKQVDRYDQPVQKPAIILSGGETTVTIKNKGGKGGRNAEFLLAFAQSVQGYNNISAIAADTDGIDGSEDNAGVLWSANIEAKAKRESLSIAKYLDRNDAWSFFNAVDALVISGPTNTNVNDFRAILIT